MEFVIDLQKAARVHKYVKRTGSPGNYQYWYKLPNGQLVSSDSSEAQSHGISHDGAKLEHAKRLLAIKMHPELANLHDMNSKQIAEHVGLDKTKVSTLSNNMKRAQRYSQGSEWQGRQFKAHDFEDHHLKEAHHHDTNSAAYRSHVGEAPSRVIDATSEVPESRQSLADRIRNATPENPVTSNTGSRTTATEVANQRRARQRSSAGGAPAEAADRRAERNAAARARRARQRGEAQHLANVGPSQAPEVTGLAPSASGQSQLLGGSGNHTYHKEGNSFVVRKRGSEISRHATEQEARNAANAAHQDEVAARSEPDEIRVERRQLDEAERANAPSRVIDATTESPVSPDDIVARVAEADARDARIAKRAEESARQEKAAKIAELRRKLAEQHGINLGGDQTQAERVGNAIRSANESVEADRQRAAEASRRLKKSFSLVIDKSQKPVVFKKSFVVDLSKSQARREALIEDIKRLRKDS